MRRLAVTLLSAFTLAACSRPARIERVILLGFDGAAPNLLEPLLAQGKLPAIRRLMESGAYGPVQSAHPTKSAILWTSIATGKTMVKHGIVDWTYLDKQGIAVPYEDRGRRVKTYWEILSEAGISTGTLNWWVSHPPAPIVNGYVVSNAFAKGDAPDSVHPKQLLPRLEALRFPYPGGVEEEMRRQGFPDWREDTAPIPVHGAREILRSYPFYFAQDMTVDRASDWLYENRPVRVFSTYFRLVDVTSHFATHFMDKGLYDAAVAKWESSGLGADDVARLDRDFARVVEPAYAFMDRTIAKYLDRLDGRTLLIVCSDHGFRFFRVRYNHANPEMAAPEGVLFVAGPGIRPGTRIEGASLYDVAPTILYAMGRPVAEDMDGKPLTAVFDGSYQASHPLTRIATYERAPRPTAGAADGQRALDEKVLEDLRTLGYIDAGGPTPSLQP